MIGALADREYYGRSLGQLFCLLAGAGLLLRGLIGFTIADTSFDFPGEGWHHLFHTLTGAALMTAAASRTAAPAAAITFGAVYGALGLIGFAGADDVGVISLQTPDNTFHTLIGLAGLGAGLVSIPGSRRAPPTAPA